MSDGFRKGFLSWSYDEVIRREGSDLDVRVVVAGIPPDVKDELKYDQIPWGRFWHGYGLAVNVPEDLEQIASPDEQTAGRALKKLGDEVLHEGGTYPPAALATPFLLRLAVAPVAHHRADLLFLVGRAARRRYCGDGTRRGLLRIEDDHPMVLLSGELENWAVRAARIAVTADVSLLLELLNDADAQVRSGACYVLATVLDGTELVSLALRRRLGVEDVPAARMSLILALAQLAREHQDESTAELLRQWWSAPDRPVDWRVSAAIAWLCLVDDPVPDDLRALLTMQITDELAEQLGGVPWMEGVDWDGGGLRRCVYLMLNPEVDWRAVHDDPWAEPSK
ncbi:HEAT repeat domain-containing protein [Spirillospora sp. NPDC049652]